MFKRKKRRAETEEFTLQRNPNMGTQNGERDYFNDFYRAYKNDYISQYLEAYHRFKDISKATDYVDRGGENPNRPKK